MSRLALRNLGWRRGERALRGCPVGACCQNTLPASDNVVGTRKRDTDKAVTETLSKK